MLCFFRRDVGCAGGDVTGVVVVTGDRIAGGGGGGGGRGGRDDAAFGEDGGVYS